MSDYPRDMIGYDRTPPHPHWPDEARLALQFVINYEEGGENCILHGDPASEAYLSELVGAQPLTGVRNLNMESMCEYGSRAGFWRLHRLFTERDLPITVYGVTMALERNPEAVPRCAMRVGKSPATAIAGSIISISANRPSANLCVWRLRTTPGQPDNSHWVGIPGALARTLADWWRKRVVFSKTPIPTPMICRIGSPITGDPTW